MAFCTLQDDMQRAETWLRCSPPSAAGALPVSGRLNLESYVLEVMFHALQSDVQCSEDYLWYACRWLLEHCR